MPVIKENHKRDFKHVKHLCGTGRLHLSLNVPEYNMESPDEERECDFDRTGMLSQQASQPTVQPHSHGGSPQVPIEA